MKIEVTGTVRPKLSTEELAELARIKPGSIRSALCRDGHWNGLRPHKLPGSRFLLWDAAEVAKVINGN